MAITKPKPNMAGFKPAKVEKKVKAAVDPSKTTLAVGKKAKVVKKPAKAKKETDTSGNVIKEQYRKDYGKAGNNGDEFAKALADAKEKEVPVEEIANANGVDLSRWTGKNPGMVRMNLGNVLRGMHRHGVDVKLGKVKIKGVEQKEAKAA